MTLFRNKYRIESTRLRNWDYAGAGWYFVTLCTQNRELFFGDVKEGEMILSPVGEIIAEEWLKTKAVRVNVELDEWIVMPNHVHGIIVITHPVETSTIKNPCRQKRRRHMRKRPNGASLRKVGSRQIH